MENLTPGIQTNDEIGNVQNQESDDTSQNITHALDLTAQKLFVGQIPRHMEEDVLAPIFSKFGDVYELAVIRDRETREHRGCAFLTFYSKDASVKAIEDLHDKITLPGALNPLQVRPAENKIDKETKLFVGMLPRSITEGELYDLFAGFGEMREVHIIRTIDGTSKGCAFVKFMKKESAAQAIDALNGHTLPGSTRPIVVKIADRKGAGARREQQPYHHAPNHHHHHNHGGFYREERGHYGGHNPHGNRRYPRPQYHHDGGYYNNNSSNGHYHQPQYTNSIPSPVMYQSPPSNPPSPYSTITPTTYPTIQPPMVPPSIVSPNFSPTFSTTSSGSTTPTEYLNGGGSSTTTSSSIFFGGPPSNSHHHHHAPPNSYYPQQHQPQQRYYQQQQQQPTYSSIPPHQQQQRRHQHTNHHHPHHPQDGYYHQEPSPVYGTNSVGYTSYYQGGHNNQVGSYYPPTSPVMITPSPTNTNSNRPQVPQEHKELQVVSGEKVVYVPVKKPPMVSEGSSSSILTNTTATNSSRSSRAPSPTLSATSSVYADESRVVAVYYLPTSVTDADLRTLFDCFGEIEDALVEVDEETGKSKGFGFLSFTTAISTLQAIEAMDGFEIDGQKLKVLKAPGSEEGVGDTSSQHSTPPNSLVDNSNILSVEQPLSQLTISSSSS